MERQDIKTAIDILDQVNVFDEVDNQMIHSVAHVLEQCGNEIERLREKLKIAEYALMCIANLRNLGKIEPEVVAFEALAKIKE